MNKTLLQNSKQAKALRNIPDAYIVDTLFGPAVIHERKDRFGLAEGLVLCLLFGAFLLFLNSQFPEGGVHGQSTIINTPSAFSFGGQG